MLHQNSVACVCQSVPLSQLGTTHQVVPKRCEYRSVPRLVPVRPQRLPAGAKQAQNSPKQAPESGVGGVPHFPALRTGTCRSTLAIVAPTKRILLTCSALSLKSRPLSLPCYPIPSFFFSFPLPPTESRLSTRLDFASNRTNLLPPNHDAPSTFFFFFFPSPHLPLSLRLVRTAGASYIMPTASRPAMV